MNKREARKRQKKKANELNESFFFTLAQEMRAEIEKLGEKDCWFNVEFKKADSPRRYAISRKMLKDTKWRSVIEIFEKPIDENAPVFYVKIIDAKYNPIVKKVLKNYEKDFMQFYITN